MPRSPRPSRSGILAASAPAREVNPLLGIDTYYRSADLLARQVLALFCYLFPVCFYLNIRELYIILGRCRQQGIVVAEMSISCMSCFFGLSGRHLSMLRMTVHAQCHQIWF